MKDLFISIAIGIAIGVIDTIPMVIKKLDPLFILSAFFMWVAVGILVPKIVFTGLFWADGILVALLFYIPLLFLIYKLDRQAIPQITLTTLLLGALTGALRRFFIP